MGKAIKAVVVQADGRSSVVEIDGSLEALQKCVGGLIQEVRWKRHFTLYVNEEGVVYNLPLNRKISATLDRALYPDGVVGAAVIFKRKGMTEEDLKFVINALG